MLRLNCVQCIGRQFYTIAWQVKRFSRSVMWIGYWPRNAEQGFASSTLKLSLYNFAVCSLARFFFFFLTGPAPTPKCLSPYPVIGLVSCIIFRSCGYQMRGHGGTGTSFQPPPWSISPGVNQLVSVSSASSCLWGNTNCTSVGYTVSSVAPSCPLPGFESVSNVPWYRRLDPIYLTYTMLL